jgi:hypothetical protein
MSQWFLNPDYMYRRGPDYCVADEQHRLVAMVTFDEDKPQETEEVIANARLIAAAPELLAACKAMLESDGLIGNQPSVLQAVELMRAAINKAEGRSD